MRAMLPTSPKEDEEDPTSASIAVRGMDAPPSADPEDGAPREFAGRVLDMVVEEVGSGYVPATNCQCTEAQFAAGKKNAGCGDLDSYADCLEANEWEVFAALDEDFAGTVSVEELRARFVVRRGIACRRRLRLRRGGEEGHQARRDDGDAHLDSR